VTPIEQPMPAPPSQASQRRMNLGIHQHRSPASLFTLYFCECNTRDCDLKIALTDGEFSKLAGGGPGGIIHRRCQSATRRRGWLGRGAR
jgi:hypothetical protein